MVASSAPGGHGTPSDPWVIAEDLLAQLPGVSGVVITTARDAGGPVEVEVFCEPPADRDRLAEQVAEVVREVTDHDDGLRVLVIALAEPDPTTAPTAARPPAPTTPSSTEPPRPAPLLGGARPVLVAADLREEGTTSRATVLLTVGGREFTGSAERVGVRDDLQIVAEATLTALERAADARREVRLRGAAMVEALGEHTVCVHVAVGDGERRELAGSALVGSGSVVDATARATLDALNRQL